MLHENRVFCLAVVATEHEVAVNSLLDHPAARPPALFHQPAPPGRGAVQGRRRAGSSGARYARDATPVTPGDQPARKLPAGSPSAPKPAGDSSSGRTF